MNTKNFIMEIEELDRNAKRGVIAEGLILNGEVHIGDRLDIVSNNTILLTHVACIEKKSIDNNNKEVHTIVVSALAEDRVRLLLTNSRADNINIGYVISTPKSIRPHVKFKANVSLLQDKKEIDNSNLEVELRFMKNLEGNGIFHILNNLEKDLLNNMCDVIVEMHSPLAIGTELKFTIFKNSKEIGTGIVEKIIE